ncbi:MAG: tetratricopeptide repeat protein [Bacteroidales bacterium]|nr:tetratricopeptide repeat protein [Bacteroidales bacterium]
MASGKTSYKYLLITGLSFIMTTCSVEKNTDTTRFYHSMTARYNIYFNGYESFKSGLLKISKGYRDDYAEMLKVFEFSDPATTSMCSSDMETAIQKASKLISLKSITAKPELKDNSPVTDKERDLLEKKEYNEWVDDSYLLIGKARFYKHEYGEAISLLNFTITDANDPDLKTEASIWLARIYNETKNYNESSRLLNDIGLRDDHPKVLKSMYYTTLADLYIKQKRYPEAIDPLSKSLKLVSGKRTKYRLTYLLAQLFEQTGDGAKATSLYREVVKMNPPYDVEFNARINIAGVFDVNSGNPLEIRKELGKMLRDTKNKDFHDQIYFALGNLSMKEGNETEALEFFRKSASANSQNQNQKGRSYLALANYFYEKPDYMKAGKYYDSTVFFLDQKHPDYQTLKTKSQSLNLLVSQLTIIQREDSLQRVASLPEAERNAIISTIIDKINKDESEGKTSTYTDQYNIGQYYENERRFQGNIEQEGKWYFYNQAALTFGRTEFRRRWGERKPEDNWRRANKARVTSAQSTANQADETEARPDSTGPVLDYKKPEFYLKDLPLTDSLKKISDEKISFALLNAGKAYSEQISDLVKATETFESLISRFPSSELIPEALYNLYKINRDINSARAESYRQKLLEKYPESEFARILSDPAYYEKKLADQKIIEKLYETAYMAYSGEKYNEALALCDDALKKYPKSDLAPKFMLLRSYVTARISDERGFKEELNKVIKTWPGTTESKKAEELIAYLNNKMPELKVEEDKQIAAELFFADTIATHVYALIIPDPAFNINLATFDVISYNIDNFTNKNYRTEGTLVDNKYIMITVSGFADYAQALSYYNLFKPDTYIRNAKGAKIMSFIISNENLKILNTDKNPQRYQLFFMEKYLK